MGVVLMGGAMLSKSLIQLSADGWGCVPSLLFDPRPNYGGGNDIIGTSFTTFHAGLSQCPQLCSTGLEKVSFHSNPKERQCQRMLKLPHNGTHLAR